MNAVWKRKLAEEKHEIQTRIDEFYSADGEKGIEADDWLGVELHLDDEAKALLRFACSFPKSGTDRTKAFDRLVAHLRAAIEKAAEENTLPAYDKPDPEDARAAFNDSLPFLDE